MNHFLLFEGLAVLLLLVISIQADAGTVDDFVADTGKTTNVFPLVTADKTVPLCYDADDYKGVIRAIGDLKADIERVTGRKPEMVTGRPKSDYSVIIGTLGNSEMIDALVASGKFDDSDLKDKWECFVITTVDKPIPGIDQALVIAGSDKRGTIYGI